MGTPSQLLHWKQLKLTPFLLFSVLATLVAAAPERQRQIRAAAGYDNVCEAAKQAYSRAKAEGKTSKIAGVVAAKTFYVEFFNSRINTIVPSCGNAVDSTHSKSIAFFNAMIKGSSNVEANVAAAEAYMPFIQKDPKADPGSACFKSQDYISK